MRNFSVKLMAALFILLSGLLQELAVYAQENSGIRGIVFHDKNGNGVYDSGQDKPLKAVAVSNGRDVVVTDRNGKYELPLRDNAAIFVVKPRNWKVAVDEKQIPRFYYMNSSGGISGTKFEGLSPTGPLPESVDFPLYPQKEPDSFDVLVFGDTQPRNSKEIYYMSHDVLPELVDVKAAFGVTLGDVTFDDLNLYDHLTSSLSTVEIPWRYVAGNHDNDYTGNNSTEARGVWYRTFGPSYYSFSYGPAHFVVLDNIRWIVEEDKRYYRTGLGSDQMEFLQNELKRVDKDQLVVFLAHIPFEGSTEWKDENEKKAFYELIATHPRSASLVAHTHQHYHYFIDKEDGFPGENPHHMISVGTVCGAWWTGAPNEYGIPHAMMSDGTPNSYTFLHVDGNNWKLSWKEAGKPADYQMHINAPDFFVADSTDKINITANIYNALPSAEVKMRVGKNGTWVNMKRTPQSDPARLAAVERENQLGEVSWLKMRGARNSEHIWEAEQEVNLEPGVHVIEIKAKDDWFEYKGKRLLHVR
ncbi:metallophosphoesterase [Mariniphaga sediminis]|uniref:Metallophosphoesterase n=1 Tax=Mariniphaga sediminis TaxID=1628158 RepID=A0A399CVY2_9BACT|nr:calcineurin-like phosphoesterase family protein [Mariniphaga sediminis]RIH63729.1 metallophosphoesterase [Mariniphaga sediminis]